MTLDIAVYIDGKGETASLYDGSKIVLYRKKRGQWNVSGEKDFILDKSLGVRDLRQKMAEAVAYLNGCRVFIGLSIAGLPYYELEKAGFSVWEFEGRPPAFLDYVLAEESGRSERTGDVVKESVGPEPVETSNGYYRISIKEIQENDTGISSKQALLPFLRQGQFKYLEILCNHVPPWLQAELMSGGYSGEIEKIDQKEVKVVLSRSCRQPVGK